MKVSIAPSMPSADLAPAPDFSGISSGRDHPQAVPVREIRRSLLEIRISRAAEVRAPGWRWFSRARGCVKKYFLPNEPGPPEPPGLSEGNHRVSVCFNG